MGRKTQASKRTKQTWSSWNEEVTGVDTNRLCWYKKKIQCCRDSEQSTLASLDPCGHPTFKVAHPTDLHLQTVHKHTTPHCCLPLSVTLGHSGPGLWSHTFPAWSTLPSVTWRLPVCPLTLHLGFVCFQRCFRLGWAPITLCACLHHSIIF